VIVALGATAAQTLLGGGFKVTQHRGEVIRDTPWAPVVMATVHPSSLLRAPDEESRRRAIAAFEADLRAVKKQVDQLKGRGRKSSQAARGLAEHPGAKARDPRGKERTADPAVSPRQRVKR
jgi:DNA polymerase